jgi:hypothetical protein
MIATGLIGAAVQLLLIGLVMAGYDNGWGCLWIAFVVIVAAIAFSAWGASCYEDGYTSRNEQTPEYRAWLAKKKKFNKENPRP